MKPCNASWDPLQFKFKVFPTFSIFTNYKLFSSPHRVETMLSMTQYSRHELGPFQPFQQLAVLLLGTLHMLCGCHIDATFEHCDSGRIYCQL